MSCAREFPELEKVRAKYEPKGVGFLALSVDPDIDEVTEGALHMGVHLTVASASSDVLAPFHVRQVPDTVYLDAHGKVVAFDRGPRNEAQFEARVKALLAQR